MGQSDVIKFLEKQKEPASRKKISEGTGIGVISVSHTLRKLLDKKEIKCIELDRIQSGELLGLGRAFRRTRFYYI